MFHSKLYGWTGVALGMLLGAGVANAATDKAGGSQDDQSMSSDDVSGCREAGVTLTFGVGSTDINARGRTSLNGVAKWLKADPTRTVRVDGYTDKTGNAARNLELSEKRADAVRNYLVAKGIDPDKIATSGHGDKTDQPSLKNTRAVAVTACGPTKTAEAAPPPEEKPAPEPAPVAETVPETPMPPPPVVVETPPPAPMPAPVIVMPPPAPAPKKDLPPSQIGLSLALGGGATGFWQDGAKSFVDIGGSWDVRMTVGTRLPIAFEGAYIGSAQSIQTLGISSDAILLGTGAEGDARVNFTRSRIQPYIFGGAGWLNYQVRNTAIATSDLNRSDNVLEVPFGAGCAFRLTRTFLIDVRGTGRVVFDDTLLKNVAAAGNAGNPGLNSWNAGAHLGWEF